MKKKSLLASIILVLAFGLVVGARAWSYSTATVMSCDSDGDKKNVFDLSESVYACGENYDDGEAVTIRVVPNKSPYTLAASVHSVPATADDKGVLGPVDLGTFDLGEYDIWVDRNGDGDFDRWCTRPEPIDTYCCRVGFHVIPEYVIGTISGLVACFAALGVFWKSKRLHQIKTP